MKVYFKGWLTVLVLALAALVMIALATQPTRAAGPWYVAPGGDDGNACTSPGAACATINGAIAKASSGDTIYVATGTYTGTGDEVVLLDQDVTLSGGWDGTFATQSGTSTIDGGGRGITVNSSVTAVVEHFTVQNGSSGQGGGIENGGTLTLNNSTVSGNTTGWDGNVGNITGSGGGIRNGGALTLNNSIVSDNIGGVGGGINNNGVLILNDSTISGNMAGGGGGISNDGSLILNGSIVSGNTAKRSGGGISNSAGVLTLNNSTVRDNTGISSGGGVLVSSGVVALDNATVNSNASSLGGGIYILDGTVSLNNSTIGGNLAGEGGGVNQEDGTVTLQNTILAGNTAGSAPDCYGTVGSSGYNLVGQTFGCTFTPGTGDLTNINANLGQLIGSPGYHPLLSDSPAIDAGNPADCTDHLGNPLDTDQRGATRVGRCDIGAYEYTAPGPTTSILAIGGTPQSTPRSLPFGTPLRALVLDDIGSPVNNAIVTFSAPASGASGTFADSGTSTMTARTDESGIVTAATLMANGLVGSYTVTATPSGVVTPTNFLLTNIGWYVSPNGNNANDCQAPTTPCATISGVLGKAGFTAGDTVMMATGTYAGTVLLGKSVRLLGGWDSTFTTQSGISIIDGEGSSRGITVNRGVVATIERFTVQNGSAYIGGGIANDGITTLDSSTVSDNASNGSGGGIHNYDTITLNDSIVSGNTAGSSGGIDNNHGTVIMNTSIISGNTATYWDGGGGGIGNAGIMTLDNSTVSSNIAVNDAGGISSGGEATLILNNSTVNSNTANDGASGGILNHGIVTLNKSSVNSNAATTNAGIYNNGGTVTLNASTVGGNTATGSGGGLTNSGTQGTLTLNNSTVSGNIAAGDGGGIYSDWYTDSQMDTILNNSTVSGNTAMRGGGIYNGSGTVTLQNSIIAGNASGNSDGLDCRGDIGSSGYNLVGDTSGCDFSPGTGDMTDANANLGLLIGSPGYHPLLSSSPAIDAGNPAGCTGSTGPLTTDQRGFARFGRCDIGAYEAQSIKTVNQSTALPGDLLAYTIAFQNGGVNGTGFRITDTLHISLTYIDDSLTATSGSYGYNNGVITWTGSVNAGGAVTITFGATVSQTVPLGTSIVNSAVISGGGEIITRTATVNVDGPICSLTKRAGNPVLSVGAGGSWDDDDVRDPAVLKEGGIYKMWYTGDDGSSPSQIGLATSTDGVNWTKDAANPVLSPSETWEAEGVTGPSVIFEGGLYKMWYTGRDSSGVSRIGYATSPDGVTWTKDGGNPVLDVGASGSWEEDGVSGSTVIKAGSTYHLWYTGDDGITPRIGHATSSDGINWTRDLGNPVLDIGPPGDWDWLGVYGPSVVKVGAEYKLWYSGGTLPEAWQTGYALSPNGSDWTRQEMLIPEGASGSFDADSADHPSVIVDGAGFRLWYSGLNDGGTYNIGYATAEICDVSTAPLANLIYLPIIFKSCPAYYTDDFSDPDSGWPVGDNSNFTFGYISSQYRIQVKNPPGGLQVTPGAKATDFAAAVSARRTSGTYGAYGIHFGINEDWSQYYEVVIDANYYSIWRYDGTWTPLRDWTTSGYINTGTSWNRLKVIREGASITVYINNHHLTTVTDGSFTGLRRIGLVAYSPSSGSLDARFDDFSLYPASCGAGAAGVGFEMGEPGVHEAPMPPGLEQSP